MLTEKYRVARLTTDMHHKNGRQTLRHRSYRHHERRTKSRERTTPVQLTNTSFFENSLLPHLSALFTRMFHDPPEHEREDDLEGGRMETKMRNGAARLKSGAFTTSRKKPPAYGVFSKATGFPASTR